MLTFKQLLTVMGLAAGSALAMGTAPAQALGFSFAPFQFSTQWTGSAPKGDIMLQSVTTGDRTISDFYTVQGANILQNDAKVGGLNNNSGAASSDRGDHVTSYGTVSEDPTNADIVSSLGNLNLNSIIDTEDRGGFTIDVSFGQALSEFLFWERGRNSALKVQAMGDGDTVLAEYLFNSRNSAPAGFSIDTREISGAQAVGAMGLKLVGTSTNRLRLTSVSNSSLYNGPDFKVVGAAPVPEPATIVGTTLAAGALAAARRKRKAAAVKA